nr:unnamed protein product [Callosobruchus analis]
MGRKCSVESCLSDSNRPEDMGVTFHKVPMHPDVRPKWMSLCHIPDDKKNVKIIYVCSRHFLRADFCNFKGKKYMLRQGVLPSVFPWDKSKLEAIKAEATIKKEKTDEPNTDVVKEELEDPTLDIKSEDSTEESNQTIEDVKIEPKEEKLDSKDQLPTDHPPPVNNLIDFTINNRIEALDFNQEWYPAKILEVDHQENEVLIHFEKFSSKYDEWVSMTSSRLRPMQQINETIEPAAITTPPVSVKVAGTTQQFEVGERCLAAWSNSQKFPATVSKVLENNTYEVLFDDGFVKTLKGHRMSKTGSKPLQASPLFEPIKSSKQDRREKKKKLNVASLFKKRHRGTGGSGSGGEASADGEKPPKKVRHKAEPSISASSATTPIPADAATDDVLNWRPLWHKGRPVGTDALLETGDGLKHTVIVPDPRLPEGWAKHLLRRNIKGGGVKWDTIIVSPENKRFRSKHEVRVFLEANPIEGLHVNMFDFCLVRSKPKKPKPPIIETPELAPVPTPIVEPQDDSQMTEEQDSQDEDNSNSLKILFEDNAYKCPIEGCGKNFRRENLAQMHVKHYHPEYTKFLDSTPNVADLAYARTVGENLDKSPGPSSRPPILKPAVKASTPRRQS